MSGRHLGKWRVQYAQVNELGLKRRLSRLFPTKTEAKSFLQTLRRGDEIEARQQKKELTLGAWFDWLAENEWPGELAERTLHGRIARFDRYVRKTFGEVPLQKIDPMVVHSFYRKLKDNQVGAATILEIKRDLVRVFNQAISPYRRVPMNVANPFRLKVETPARREAVALTPEQAKKALQSADLDKDRRAILALYLFAGVRLSEQMALTVDQLLFEQGLVFIDRAVKFGKGGKQTVGLPKGDKKRLAVMCPTLKAILQEAVKGKTLGQFVWPAATENKPRMKKLVYATWRTIVKDAGLPPAMTPHDGRLTHINWIEKLMPDVSPTTLKEHVGHAAEGVTQVNYTRPLSSAQKILRDNLESLVGWSRKDEQTRGSARRGSHTPLAART